MTNGTVIIQLGRYGDLASIAPVASYLHNLGNERVPAAVADPIGPIRWIVHERFADFMELIPYVEPVVFKGRDNDVGAAIEMAKRMFPGARMIIPQVNGNPFRSPERMESFQGEQWIRSGFLEKFHELPLVLDVPWKPKTPRERPIIGLCLESHSSIFYLADVFLHDLVDAAEGFDVKLIGHTRRPKLSMLVDEIRDLDYLVTVDSLPLHLSWESRVPTVALSRDLGYYRSERRTHWIGSLTYSQAVQDPARVVQMICENEPIEVRQPDQMEARLIIHVVPTYIHPDRLTSQRQGRAEATWVRAKENDFYWQTVKHLPHGRTSADLGDERRLQYVRDVFDFGCAHVERDGDIIIVTNDDTQLSDETAALVRDALDSHPCCTSSRINLPNMGVIRSVLDLAEGEEHDGCDLFACTRGWWKQHRESYPDMFVGAEAWDYVMKHTMWNNGGVHLRPIVGHEHHDPYWARHLEHDVARAHNRLLTRKWAKANRDQYIIDYLDKNNTPNEVLC